MAATNPEPLSIDDALAAILDAVTPLDREPVPLADADGRVLVEDVTATVDLPPFTNSAMDGYAVRAADTPGALTVAGESAAGKPYRGTVAAGQAITISTGAVLPDGADAVVQVERVEGVGTDTITVPQIDPNLFVRARGSDISAGARVLAAGTVLGPAQIGAAAANGVVELACGRRPRVAILSTGDELRKPGQPLGPGQIYESNTPMLAAAVARTGALVSSIRTAADTPEAHQVALAAALQHDVVITTGGVSVGPHDLVRGVGADLGVEELFWRIKMRPGKPLSVGTAGTTMIFGLPGNPVSVLVCFTVFVRPALMALQGAADPGPHFRPAPLATAVRQLAERDDMIRVSILPDGTLAPVSGQASHQLATAAGADHLARIPAGTGEFAAGTRVDTVAL